MGARSRAQSEDAAESFSPPVQHKELRPPFGRSQSAPGVMVGSWLEPPRSVRKPQKGV